MTWFGNGLGTDIDPGLLIRKPTPRLKIDQSSWTSPTARRDELERMADEAEAAERANALRRAEEWARTHESDGEYFRRTGQDRGAQEYHEGVASRDLRRRTTQAQIDARRVGESDGEYFRRTGQQRGGQEYQEGVDRRAAAAAAETVRKERARIIAERGVIDEFEAGKEALDRQHLDKKVGFYYDRDGVKRYYTPSTKPKPTKPFFSTTEKPKIDQSSWSPTPRKPASHYATTTKPRTTKPIFSTTPTTTTPTTTPTVPIDPTLLKPDRYVAPVSRPTPRKPAAHYAPTAKPQTLLTTTLPSTQVSLLEAKEHLNVVKPAEERPTPSYLTTAEYDNPGKRQPFDHKGWRFQDRVVAAVLPFNKPNREWEDPGEAVKASAKFRQALIDTDYSEKRRKYIDAKSRLENQKAALKTIKKNVKNLQDVESLSGLGHTEHTPTGDLLEYWKKEESKAEAELVKLQATFNDARTAEMNAGREVKVARNKMDKYLSRGPYTKDTYATIGGLFSMALGGLIVFNIIVPTTIKKKTRNLNPLYSVFA